MVKTAMALHLHLARTLLAWRVTRQLPPSTLSQEAARSLRAVEKVSFSLEDAQELAASDNKKSNAVSLVTSMNSCPADTEQVCLEFSSVIESKRFDSLYKQIDLAPEEFKKLVNEEVENNAATDKAPSSYFTGRAATTPGTKPDLNASFVSANAEQFYQYQPTEIILSEGRLVDSQGMVLLVSTITPIPAVV